MHCRQHIVELYSTLHMDTILDPVVQRVISLTVINSLFIGFVQLGPDIDCMHYHLL